MLDARLLQAQGHTQVEIAGILGVCERTVRNYLKQMPQARKGPKRPSKLDPFKQVILDQLEENPSYNGELIFERIARMGYTGHKTVMKDFVAKTRRRIAATAVQRFEIEPGRQAQVDWKEFGKQGVDGHVTRLYAFVWSSATRGNPSCISRPQWIRTRSLRAMYSSSHTSAE